ncbi:MAG: GDSL-type esterase/lipase family protein [Chitinophagales bacterium]
MKKIMHMFKLRMASLLLLLRITHTASAQAKQPDFSEEIKYYRSVDSDKSIPKSPILFVGSSSIKNWMRFDSTFAGYPVLNRGFGGSTLKDQIQYANDILLPHTPRQIVIYCGENDFANSDSITAATVFNRFVSYYTIIRKNYPEVPVLYISLKPSPAKRHMMQKITTFNDMMAAFAAQEKNLMFVDIYTSMLSEDGKPDPEYFGADLTHMNQKGYDIWTAQVKPLLLR